MKRQAVSSSLRRASSASEKDVIPEQLSRFFQTFVNEARLFDTGFSRKITVFRLRIYPPGREPFRIIFSDLA